MVRDIPLLLKIRFEQQIDKTLLDLTASPLTREMDQSMRIPAAPRPTPKFKFNPDLLACTRQPIIKLLCPLVAILLQKSFALVDAGLSRCAGLRRIEIEGVP